MTTSGLRGETLVVTYTLGFIFCEGSDAAIVRRLYSCIVRLTSVQGAKIALRDDFRFYSNVVVNSLVLDFGLSLVLKYIRVVRSLLGRLAIYTTRYVPRYGYYFLDYAC